MALIKLSSIGITNLSGKAGGSVYAHNRGGAYVRNFAMPTNPSTAPQSAQRAVFGAFASAWRGLSEVQRINWNDSAVNFPYINRFGDSKVLSGQNLYISLNRNLQIVGGTAIQSPPTTEGTDGIVSASMVISASAQTYLLTSALAGNSSATTEYAVYATTGMSAGISNAKNKFRFLGHLDEATVVSTDLEAQYRAVFGAAVQDQKIFFRLDPINQVTGERGASIELSTIVDA